MTEDLYRHHNGLKHINIINDEGFSALFVVNTPVFDNSGVAHGVEHMVFRGSDAFPKPVSLFQLTALTDVKINASTLAETTFFHCQSQCHHTFSLAMNYLLNGIFNPVFNVNDFPCEIHDGKDKGVIFRELMGVEQIGRNNEEVTDESSFCYGGISTSIGDLSVKDLSDFHHQYYQANNIILVTANANIEQISQVILLFPTSKNQSNQKEITVNKDYIQRKESDDSVNHKKFSTEINKLITVYRLWLQDPYHQEVDDFKEIEYSIETGQNSQSTLAVCSQSKLIPPLNILSTKLKNEANVLQVKDKYKVDKYVKDTSCEKTENKTLLPNLFNDLYQQAKKQLTGNELNVHLSHAYVCDQSNALLIAPVSDTEKKLATITGYIISAYPKFLAPRCQGFCYATQALTIEKSAYLAIYSAFDVSPETRLKEVYFCLLKLSQDDSFIFTSLALAKIKYCRVNQVNNSQVKNITATDISAYLQILTNKVLL